MPDALPPDPDAPVPLMIDAAAGVATVPRGDTRS
jgi:hypothetical protein